MVVEVLIDIAARALDAPFSYSWPDTEGAPQVGDCVLVGFGARPALGYVTAVNEDAEADENTKTVTEVLTRGLFDAAALDLARWISSWYAAPLISCLRLFLASATIPRLKKQADGSYEVIAPVKARKQSPGAAPGPLINEADRPARLSDGQDRALEVLSAALRSAQPQAFVLAGVTGSGKTEVYLQAIEQSLTAGKTCLTLVPEISLTPQTVGRYRARFSDQVAVLHSRLTPRQRANEFARIRSGEAPVVVGARSALFAPHHDLGLIVIDEEHDSSYKQNNSPRYHARAVAEQLALRQGAVLILGSATPSLESLEAAREGRGEVLPCRKLTLPERINGAALPPVTIVDMTREFERGNRSLFSVRLQQGLHEVYERGEKALLLLNRRGFSSFLLCRECGFVPHCESCSTSLSFHATNNTLRCHQCDASFVVYERCPQCGSPYLRKFGVGTQQVEEELKRLIPGWSVVRMDRDTTSGAHAHEELLKIFQEQESGVLVGTQMIAKGHDFPDVTLVGVVTADITLNIPDFRAPERTYQLLEQVSGRAGRDRLPGQVIIQTYLPQEPAIEAVAAHDPSALYEEERRLRRELGYPPFGHLCNILLSSEDQERVARFSQELARALRDDVASCSPEVQVLGPSPCIIERAKRLWRFHILLKSDRALPLGPLVSTALKSLGPARGVNIAVDVDPYEMM
ncbi:MAG: primosomal protein N' [Actinomycetia bacterium]|nr:primosomal protein N' [Actinomycetes bacterium]